MPVITNVIVRCDFCAREAPAGSSCVGSLYTVPRHPSHHALYAPVDTFMPAGWAVLGFGTKGRFVEHLTCDECVSKIYAVLPPPASSPATTSTTTHEVVDAH